MAGARPRRGGRLGRADGGRQSRSALELVINGFARRNVTTAKGLRDRGIIAVLLGGALRRSAVAALTDERSSGGFTLEATGAARHATTLELSV